MITADDEGEHLPAESPYPGLPFRVFLQRVKLQNDVSEAIHGCRHDQAWQPLYAEYGLPDD